jgi:arylsulfatase A-like enzyme
VELLQGAESPAWRREVVTTYNGQQFGLYTQRMLRTGRWKYVWNTTDRDELYDMENDPHELVNRAANAANRSLLGELRERLYHTLIEEGDPLVANQWLRHQLLDDAKV